MIRKAIADVTLNSNIFKEQISVLENENDCFRNVLGMKKKVTFQEKKI